MSRVVCVVCVVRREFVCSLCVVGCMVPVVCYVLCIVCNAWFVVSCALFVTRLLHWVVCFLVVVRYGCLLYIDLFV